MQEVLYTLIQQEQKRREEIKNKYNWKLHARENQKMPAGDWKIWLIMAGRGFGKTRTGAESIKQLIEQGYKRVCLLGDTELDVLNVMLNGESGLINIYPLDQQPKISKSERIIKWNNGAQAMIISATAYEQLRGPQFDCAWVDELAKFPDPKAALDQLLLALRLNSSTNLMPKLIITTTPKSLPLLKELIARKDVFVTYGSTFDNAQNLSAAFLDTISDRFENSKFGAQEMYGQIIEDDQDAFCKYDMIKKEVVDFKECSKIIIAIDPAATNKRDETGIVVCGQLEHDKFAVLEDASGLYSPVEWAKKALELYNKYNADCIVAEVNQGGDMVEALIRQEDKYVVYEKVYATRGKFVRAQPVSALYEKGRIVHANTFIALEEQMCQSCHSHSPDRLDALVWGLTFLMKNQSDGQKFFMFDI